MQSDPLGLEGGENSFVYIHNDPLLRSDPDGRGKIGTVVRLTKKAWNHIFQRHIKRYGKYAFKSKFKDPKFVKKIHRKSY